MNKSEVILKRIQVDKLFQASPKRTISQVLSRSSKTEPKVSQPRVVTSVTIKQKNARISRKTYNNLKIFSSFSKSPQRLKSGCEHRASMDNYGRKSEQLYRHKLHINDPEDQNFTYKPFPKRMAYVKNNNAAKFFCPSGGKNYNFINFLSEDFYLDIKLCESASFCKGAYITDGNETPGKSYRDSIKTSSTHYGNFLSSRNKPYTADHGGRRPNARSSIRKQMLSPWDNFGEEEQQNFAEQQPN